MEESGEVGRDGGNGSALITGLAPRQNFHEQSPASVEMVTRRDNVPSLSLAGNNSVDGCKQEEGERADGPPDEVEVHRQGRRINAYGERKQQRKPGTAESSAKARERKKKHIADLEATVTRLTEENSRLIEANNRLKEELMNRLKEENIRLKKENSTKKTEEEHNIS